MIGLSSGQRIEQKGQILGHNWSRFAFQSRLASHQTVIDHFNYLINHFIRPTHFAFKPGDYVYINIPRIATFEWHPFTISSAPEQVINLN